MLNLINDVAHICHAYRCNCERRIADLHNPGDSSLVSLVLINMERNELGGRAAAILILRAPISLQPTISQARSVDSTFWRKAFTETFNERRPGSPTDSCNAATVLLLYNVHPTRKACLLHLLSGLFGEAMINHKAE